MPTECAICRGSGFEIVRDAAGREAAKPCSCRRAAARGANDLLTGLRIPPAYRHCTLGGFESASAPALAAAWEKAAAFASGFPHTGEAAGLGLLLMGSTGVGKTHLAVAVLRELAESKGVRGAFWDFNELMREIRASYDPEVRMTEAQVLDPIIRADLLVLDDLGAWKMTDWMNDTLFHILNQRYVHQRPSIITTNFDDRDPDDIRAEDGSGKWMTDRKEYLVERIGNRLRSRLLGMSVTLKLNGPDHRVVARQHFNQKALSR
jgi:DNA replication protein DnaC